MPSPKGCKVPLRLLVSFINNDVVVVVVAYDCGEFELVIHEVDAPVNSFACKLFHLQFDPVAKYDNVLGWFEADTRHMGGAAKEGHSAQGT